MINGVTEMRVKVEGGYIIATASCDPEYPGIDVEFEPDNSDKESERLSNPRVLLEKPIDSSHFVDGFSDGRLHTGSSFRVRNSEY